MKKTYLVFARDPLGYIISDDVLGPGEYPSLESAQAQKTFLENAYKNVSIFERMEDSK